VWYVKTVSGVLEVFYILEEGEDLHRVELGEEGGDNLAVVDCALGAIKSEHRTASNGPGIDDPRGETEDEDLGPVGLAMNEGAHLVLLLREALLGGGVEPVFVLALVPTAEPGAEIDEGEQRRDECEEEDKCMGGRACEGEEDVGVCGELGGEREQADEVQGWEQAKAAHAGKGTDEEVGFLQQIAGDGIRKGGCV
jgi:hypothetical protein